MFSHTLGILLSFWHTFKYFGILSQLLAHCADLSKSEGQLCCCHETGVKQFLFTLELRPLKRTNFSTHYRVEFEN